MATTMNYKLKLIIPLLLVSIYSLIGCNNENLGTATSNPFEDSTLPLFYVTGNKSDVKTNPQSGIVLAGGGTDNDEAMKWMLERANGGDVVVIRSSGSNGYNSYFHKELGIPVNSVTTIIIDSRDKANNDSVFKTICNAELLFIAGGDQSKYIKYWRNTKVDKAIDYLINTKKVTIGGTSAGMAVLSEFCYSGDNGSVVSQEALSNPYHNKIVIKNSFIHMDMLRNTITDTHFSQRNREGRLITFLARIAKENNITPKAIAADEKSVLCIDEQGNARVFGGKIHFYKSSENLPQTCLSGIPLNWESPKGAISVYTVQENEDIFDIKTWSPPHGMNWRNINIVNGEIITLNI